MTRYRNILDIEEQVPNIVEDVIKVFQIDTTTSGCTLVYCKCDSEGNAVKDYRTTFVLPAGVADTIISSVIEEARVAGVLASGTTQSS